MKFQAILIDFPTPFKVYSEKTGVTSRAAKSKYELMTWDDMAAMWPYVEQVMAKDCCVFVWASAPLYPEILALMTDGWWTPGPDTITDEGDVLATKVQTISGWQLDFKTVAFTWCKVLRTDPHKLFGGMGYWTRANAEQCWLFTRGKPGRVSKDVLQALQTIIDPDASPIVADRIAAHSAKPDEVHRRIERLLGPDAQCLELFARRRQLEGNWTTIGFELDGMDIIDSLDHVARDESLPVIGDTLFAKSEPFDVE